jgi:hypothetical protein
MATLSHSLTRRAIIGVAALVVTFGIAGVVALFGRLLAQSRIE